MPQRYIEKWRSRGFNAQQVDSITSLAFSHDGIYLASGDLTGVLLICLTATGQRLHIVLAKSGLLSLSWAPLPSYELWVGCADGLLLQVVILPVRMVFVETFRH
jgi:WD40 repeat protein